MAIFICLPCRNEAQSLPPLFEKFLPVIASIDEPARLIAVENGSTDRTREVLAEWSDKAPLDWVVNEAVGLGPAIMRGLQEALSRSDADEDIVVCLDADDTHDPEYIPQMIARIRQGADLVIASRYQTGSREVGVPGFRRLLSHGARWVFRLALPIAGVRDYTCGFRAYRADLLRRAMDLYGDRLIERSGFACTDELLVKLSVLTQRIEEVPFVLRYDHKRGASQLPLIETILATLKLIHRGRQLLRQARKSVKSA